MLPVCHTTLWNINVRKQTINYKLQGSVAAYFRRGGVVNNQIKIYCWVKKKLKLVNIWESYKQERGCLIHSALVATTLLKDEESAQAASSFAQIYFFPKSICR